MMAHFMLRHARVALWSNAVAPPDCCALLEAKCPQGTCQRSIVRWSTSSLKERESKMSPLKKIRASWACLRCWFGAHFVAEVLLVHIFKIFIRRNKFFKVDLWCHWQMIATWKLNTVLIWNVWSKICLKTKLSWFSLFSPWNHQESHQQCVSR